MRELYLFLLEIGVRYFILKLLKTYWRNDVITRYLSKVKYSETLSMRELYLNQYNYFLIIIYHFVYRKVTN
jgi:hypothetical protein